MTWDEFEKEIERLKTQWQNAYGEERKATLFYAFKNTDTAVFHDAVSKCLANARQAPLLEDLSKEIEAGRRRVLNFNRGPQDPVSALNAIRAGTADPDFVTACKEVLAKKQRGEYSSEQFNQACDYLDQTAKEFEKQKGIRRCAHCGGSGLVYETDKMGYRYVSRCSCSMGDGHSSQIPRHQPKLKPVPPPTGRDLATGKDE